MKRSAGLKPSSPEQIRAWRQRSKQLDRGPGPKARPKRLSRAERDAHAAWQRIVLGYPCWFRDHRPGHECRGRRDPHHLLPAQAIRQRFTGRPESELLAVLYAPSIGAPLCRAAHAQIHSSGPDRTWIWWDELTPECIETARRAGMEGRLLQACPERPTSERRDVVLGRGCADCGETLVGDRCPGCGAHWGADG